MYVIKNIHSKSVQLPGGLLAPGHTRIIDLSDELYGYLEYSPFLEIKKEVKNKAKKKAKKKD